MFPDLCEWLSFHQEDPLLRAIICASFGRPNRMNQTLPDTISASQFDDCADHIVETARELAGKGWTPATSSNFSTRVDADHIAITISGRDKGKLRHADIMLVDLQGNAVGSDARPSAETALHTQIYRRCPTVGAVLHTHSRAQSVASHLFAAEGEFACRDGNCRRQSVATTHMRACWRSRCSRTPSAWASWWHGSMHGWMRASRCMPT